MSDSTDKDNKAAALTYNGRKTPIISALGEDKQARAIVKLAEENKVPIYQDEDLVRILSQFEVGQPVPPELYEWVARVLAFAFFVKDQVPEGFSPSATRSAYQRVRDAYGKPDITP
ncbi:MAG: EscU/YscU/HrcU family type III secretion system export apparatus switch protein [Saccharospirillum sp.]|nr:EscU/YscU/HrcU family type III secretion system export apparatus switch protein [Saccharospirillum sp.]